jgi:hypothetical protein
VSSGTQDGDDGVVPTVMVNLDDYTLTDLSDIRSGPGRRIVDQVINEVVHPELAVAAFQSSLDAEEAKAPERETGG